MQEVQKKIIDYYDQCFDHYRFFWDLDRSLAMHAGYWDASTKNLNEALRRENEILAQMAGISSGDHVLDAGCGVGGSSIFLANTFGCKVTGITLSAKQAEVARKKSFKFCKKENVPEFLVMDYTQTAFLDQSFDVVWAVESVCHAEKKEDFLKEAYRILRPGGRLIVADGFVHKSSLNNDRKMISWISGFGCQSLATIDEFIVAMDKLGFSNVSKKDITSNVLPSSKKLYRISFLGIPFYTLLHMLGKASATKKANLVAARDQYLTLSKGLWSYYIVLGYKK